MNSQSIECECGCWNIVVKVVPPGEPCPYCGSSEPHDCCPEKCKALGLPMPEEDESCNKGPEPGGGYNVFQFERCDCGCSTLHYVEADEDCAAMAHKAKSQAPREPRPCCDPSKPPKQTTFKTMAPRTRRCTADGQWLPYGKPKTSTVGKVRPRPCAPAGPPCGTCGPAPKTCAAPQPRCSRPALCR